MSDPLPIDFERERDEQTGSWQRACDEPTLIERVAWDRWLVTFADSDDTHLVRLFREAGRYLGHCHIHGDDGLDDCPGWAYHSGPCAHLCAIRRAEFGAALDTHGQPVRVFDAESVADERADPHVEQAVAADGGERR